jgi:hypothetical protein
MRRLAGWTPKPESKSQKAVAPAYVCSTCHKVRRQQAPVDDLVERVIIARLERLDAVELFSQADQETVTAARDAIAAIDARLATAADSFAADDIDADQLRRITATLRAKRAEHEAIRNAALPPAVPAEAVGPRAREVWDTLDIDRKRGIIDALTPVVILPGGVGKNVFDPELIRFPGLEEQR